MASQNRLKQIRNTLSQRFCFLTSKYEIQKRVEACMRRYITSGLYTDSRCSLIFDELIKYVEAEVNSAYKEIAEEINKEIDELISETAIESSSDEFSNYNLEHLAVGAGAGLGAAIIFGGPVGWLVGIGALFGAAYNSSQKKKGLIDKIHDVAVRINDEAITKLKKMLDKLILPEPKKLVLKKRSAVVPALDQDSVDVLTEEQVEIKKFLESRGIKYLVHFTDKENYDSIMENGILSVSEGKRRGIELRVKDNRISSNKTFPYMKSDNQDYISLSVTNVNTDLIRAYRASGRIKNIIVIYIDASVLWKEIESDRIYCNMNASKYEVSFSRELKGFEDMFAERITQYDFITGIPTTYDRNSDKRNSNETTNPKAEILFEKRIDPKYFINPVEEY